jgi:hypothetical protein
MLQYTLAARVPAGVFLRSSRTMTTTNISKGTAQSLSLYEEMDPMLNGEEKEVSRRLLSTEELVLHFTVLASFATFDS